MPTSLTTSSLFALALACAAAPSLAGPVAGGTLGLLVDGTSNTVLLTEQTRVAACIDLGDASLPPIVDGTSNTLLFGESLALTLRVGTRYPWQSIGNLLDGTSNTIFIGEIEPNRICLGGETRLADVGSTIVDGTSNTIAFGEGGRLDLCLRDVAVGQVVDGSSNTVFFGEVSATPACFSDVRVTDTNPGPSIAAVPLPGTLALLGLGVAGLCSTRTRPRTGTR